MDTLSSSCESTSNDFIYEAFRCSFADASQNILLKSTKTRLDMTRMHFLLLTNHLTDAVKQKSEYVTKLLFVDEISNRHYIGSLHPTP